jgi:NADP-dependent 3-hydroxy acid dehydrogenase YdfG
VSLAHQIALVTGASSGVGRAIALALAQQGADLCLVGRQPETLQEVAHQARAHSSKVFCYQADLRLDNNIQDLAAGVQQHFEGIDILIHSAGVIELDPMECASLEDLDRHYKVNFRAPYVLTQALLPTLRSRKGQIIFINSSVGLIAKAGVGQYAATKHALKAVADSLREEVNAEGLRVLSVFLGRTATPMQAAVHGKEERVYQPDRLLQPEDVATVVINALTLPRTAEITEIHIRPLNKPGAPETSNH